MSLRSSLAILLLLMNSALTLAQTSPPPPPPSTLDINQPGVTLQQTIDFLHSQIPAADSGEGGGQDQLKFYETFWRDRAVTNDSSGSNMFMNYFRGLHTDMVTRATTSCSGYQGNWSVFGPDTLDRENIGYVASIWADPADSNYLLAGTEGGLFKTTNGGKLWSCISDNGNFVAGGILDISHISVNPLNKNAIYLGTTSERLLNGQVLGFNWEQWGTWGAGIVESFDGGAHWQQEIIPFYRWWPDSIETVPHVYISPDTTRLYAIIGDSLYTRANNPPGNWQNITPANSTPNSGWYNLAFVPGQPNHFFVSNASADTGAAIYESKVAVPNASDWHRITSGISDILIDPKCTGITEAITGDSIAIYNFSIPDSNNLYAIGMYRQIYDTCIGKTINVLAGLWKYNLNGTTHTWQRMNNALPFSGNPNGGHFSIIVSPQNESNVYYGTDIIYQSVDSGKTFIEMGPYGGPNCHGDIRSICLQKATNTTHGIGDILFIATDGGVSKKPAGADVTVLGDNTVLNISGKGLACGDFWGVSVSEAGGYAVGGMMHDGIPAYEPDQPMKWSIAKAGDSYSTIFDNKNRQKVYGLPNGDFEHSYPAKGRKIGGFTTDNYIRDVSRTAPTFFNDEYNNMSVGAARVWTRPYGSALFSPKRNIGLPNDSTATDVIRTMIFNPYDSTYTGYVIYNNTNGRKLFWYNNIQISGLINTFIQVDTVPNVGSASGSYLITDVTMDPMHPARVWVGLGDNNPNINSGGTVNRVLYSDSSGSTLTSWHDVSYGLPQHVPVSKIVYKEGSNMLYCATDAGIYSCDFSTYNPTAAHNGVSWNCFNKGANGSNDFPNCYVTDLKINYCQNKLYAATYGRSIWSTDLDTNIIKPNPIGFTDSITSNTTWSQEVYHTGSIYVAPGKTLTLTNMTLHMPKNGRIAVAAKGKLIVDSSTITNDCASCMWKGIEAWGNNAKGQQPYNQATVIIKRHSVIQHARMGVANWDETDSNFSTTGGIIQASNSYFYNNHVSVSFAPYQNFTGSYPGTPAKDISSFTLDSFSIDNGYKGAPVEYKFMAHASIINDYGIIFAGCKFNNLKHAGVGIYAMEGGFYCLPYYDIGDFAHANPHHSKFRGFERGIDVESAMLLNPEVSIDNTDFDTCGAGVYISGQDNVSTTRCNFTVGDGAFVSEVTGDACGQNIGIYAKNAHMFRIEQNTMTGMGSSVITNYGVAVENSYLPGDMISNAVYKCNFSNLNYGCFANGNNGNYSGPGLHFLCNSFSHDTVDIGVAATGSIPYQGSMDTSAGNTFAGGNIVNNGSHINYYYNGSSQKPGRVNSGVYLDSAAYANSCAATFDDAIASPTAISAGELAGLKSGFKNTQGSLSGLNNTYNGLMDGGSTTSMVNLIHSGRGATIIYDTLMAHTPYLSLTVLEATGSSNVLSYSQYYNVLYACPDELRDAALINFIQHSIPTPIQPGDINTLQTRAATNTARTKLESQCYDASTLMGGYANKIMIGLKTDNDTTWLAFDTNSDNAQFDSTSSYQYLDSAGVWLQNIGDLSSKYQLAGYYMYGNNYSAASSVLNSIPQTYNLNTQLRLQQNFYDTLYTILNGLHNAGRNVYQLTSGEVTRLSRLAADTTYNTASIIAHNLTNFGWAISFSSVVKSFPITCVQLPGALAGSHKQPEPQAMQNEPGTNSVIAYPNPTRDAVTFDYNILQYNGNAQLSISDVVGQLVMMMPLQNGQGSLKWDVSHMPSGVYIYKLSCGGVTIGNGKLTIIK